MGRPRKENISEKNRKEEKLEKRVKNPVGNRVIEITPEMLQKVENLTARGFSKAKIAPVLGMSIATLCDKQNKHVELLDAFKKGKERLLDSIEDVLYSKALDERDTACCIFIAKTQGKNRGWTTQPDAQTENDRNINIFVNGAPTSSVEKK